MAPKDRPARRYLEMVFLYFIAILADRQPAALPGLKVAEYDGDFRLPR